MTTRLRFKKVNHNLVANNLQSNKHNDVLSVLLDATTLTGTIQTSTNEVVCELSAPSLVLLKKLTKITLVDQGVVFLDELRQPKNVQEETKHVA